MDEGTSQEECAVCAVDPSHAATHESGDTDVATDTDTDSDTANEETATPSEETDGDDAAV